MRLAITTFAPSSLLTAPAPILASVGKEWRLGAGVLALATMAGCEYFSDVTVPAVDNTPPTAYAAVWRSDVYEAISNNPGAPLVFEVSDPNDYYMLVGAGTDAGGTKKVTIAHEFTRSCIQGGLGQFQSGLMAPMVETQSGSVGQTVSNGVWGGPYVRLSDYMTCNPGWTLTSVAYHWHVTAEDFHGNKSSHGWAKIHWTP
jgi:hypothetical protein